MLLQVPPSPKRSASIFTVPPRLTADGERQCQEARAQPCGSKVESGTLTRSGFDSVGLNRTKQVPSVERVSFFIVPVSFSIFFVLSVAPESYVDHFDWAPVSSDAVGETVGVT